MRNWGAANFARLPLRLIVQYIFIIITLERDVVLVLGLGCSLSRGVKVRLGILLRYQEKGIGLQWEYSRVVGFPQGTWHVEVCRVSGQMIYSCSRLRHPSMTPGTHPTLEYLPIVTPLPGVHSSLSCGRRMQALLPCRPLAEHYFHFHHRQQAARAFGGAQAIRWLMAAGMELPDRPPQCVIRAPPSRVLCANGFLYLRTVPWSPAVVTQVTKRPFEGSCHTTAHHSAYLQGNGRPSLAIQHTA